MDGTHSPGSDDARRGVGAALVLASAVFFSLSGVLTKAIDAGSWAILAWRGVIGGVIIAAYVWLRPRHGAWPSLRLDRHGWLLAFVGGVGSITFITAFKNTLVANVSVIYAAIPFVAALLERLLLGAPLARRTLAAAIVSAAGVVLIVGGSLGSPNLAGDGIALVMVVLNALYMVLIRMFPDTDPVLAGAASGPMLFVAGAVISNPLAVSRSDALLLVVFGLVFAAATILWIEGTRRIAAAESGLLGSAETPIAIGLAWLVLSEAPPAASIGGAVVVLAAVLWHALTDLGPR